MIEKIIINFQGPYSFLDNDLSVSKSPIFDKKCIYLWTFKQKNDSYLIHYVGETVSFAKRQREHLINILGLNYGIWDIDEAERGISKIIWNGLWRIKDRISIGNLIEIYDKHNKDIIKYISRINIFAGEINCSDTLRKHIEGCIGWNLRNKYPEYKLFYPDDNHVGISNKKNLKLYLNYNNILGLDKEMDL